MGVDPKVSKLLDWLGESCAVTPAGKPALVYRPEGPPQPPRNCLELRGSHRYLAGAKVQTKGAQMAYLKIENPAVHSLTEPLVRFDRIIEMIGRKRAEKLAWELCGYVERTPSWNDPRTGLGLEFEHVGVLLSKAPERLDECHVEAARVFESARYVTFLRQAGFDGAVFPRAGGDATMEYHVFSDDQIMPVTSRVLHRELDVDLTP